MGNIPGHGEPPAAAIMRLLTGGWVAQAVHAAATLGIADRLAEGPRSPDDLAAPVEADPDALYRPLRALAGVGGWGPEEHSSSSRSRRAGRRRAAGSECLAINAGPAGE
jgi:hypothetical protein